MFVEMIGRSELHQLEGVINAELADLIKHGVEIVDIKYSCMAYHIPYDVRTEYTAMIIYKESE